MQQNETPLIRDLRKYYDRDGIKILSTKFDCEHKCKCRGGLPLTPKGATTPEKVEGTFTQAKSAYVGERYGVGVPRLLFVSSDPGSAMYHPKHYNFVSDENRTPESVRRIEIEGLEEMGFKHSRPWQCNHEMTRAILGLSISDAKEALPYFANINAAKCCRNNKGKSEAGNRALFENCRVYLRGEINVLAPDIIVSQGEWAKKGMEYAFRVSSEWAREQSVPLRDGKEAVWFPSYHPSSYGPYKKQEQQRNQFVQKMRERFVDPEKKIPPQPRGMI